MTLGDALEAVDLKKAAPEPVDDDDDDLEDSPPPSTEPPPAAVSSPDDEDPDSFAQLAGKVSTTIGIQILTTIHRRQGREPAELDDDEVERLETETTKVVRRGIGDKQIPWWAPVVSAWGMAYFSMGQGARPLGTPVETAAPSEPAAPASAPSSPVPPPPGPVPGYVRAPSTKPAPIVIGGSRVA